MKGKILLTDRDKKIFFDAIFVDDIKPNKYLKKAFKRYNKMKKERDGL